MNELTVRKLKLELEANSLERETLEYDLAIATATD